MIHPITGSAVRGIASVNADVATRHDLDSAFDSRFPFPIPDYVDLSFKDR
jgi:hypothetical protein